MTMACRRTRIKGIANIPQRRKTTQPETEPTVSEELTESVTLLNDTKDSVEKTIVDVKEAPTSSEPLPAPPDSASKTVRRKFIKPPVSLNAIKRSNGNDSVRVEQPETPPPPKTPELKNGAEKEITLNETILAPSRTNQNDVNEKGVKKVNPNVQIHNELEYPPPPTSPSKINRSRIKAIPKFSQRKYSFSASESEDESRRYQLNPNRNRNDSICSTASGSTELSNIECLSPQKIKDPVQKKCRRTEQSRKISEAKREFFLKFRGNKPDRQKLTMLDLIFYNPTTNPMSNEVKKPEDEEVADDPERQAALEEAEEISDEDEENEMPAPQIKIGPNGQIVVDEKSLVIENKQTKKDRQELAKSKLINGDFETGYGIYKRAKRSKDWSTLETIRFYKALSTIGTDFTLMCELFPRRSRRELKMKFKKEERINSVLIDKALTDPGDFNFNELKEQVDLEEQEIQAKEKLIQDDAKECQEKKARGVKRGKRKRTTGEILVENHVEKRRSDSDVSECEEELTPDESNKKAKHQEENEMEPGSIVVMEKEPNNGQVELQIYMVTASGEQAEEQNLFTITAQKLNEAEEIQIDNRIEINEDSISFPLDDLEQENGTDVIG